MLDKIKTLGANPSNADREFIEKTVPRIGTDPAALPQLLDFMEQRAASRSANSTRRSRPFKASKAQFLPFQLGGSRASATVACRTSQRDGQCAIKVR